MSDVSGQHRASSPQQLRCAVLTVSDSRTLATDRGGALIVELLEGAGHEVSDRAIVADDPQRMRPILVTWGSREDVDAILVTGGTGLSSRDRTCETVRELMTKELPGYGELFRMLSFAEIGSAAMMSRAVGGLLGRTPILTMPGSPAGVRLAMERVILPELGHLVREARR